MPDPADRPFTDQDRKPAALNCTTHSKCARGPLNAQLQILPLCTQQAHSWFAINTKRHLGWLGTHAFFTTASHGTPSASYNPNLPLPGNSFPSPRRWAPTTTSGCACSHHHHGQGTHPATRSTNRCAQQKRVMGVLVVVTTSAATSTVAVAPGPSAPAR